MERRRAFMLTELVIALGIAALLAALSLAVYGYAQKQATQNGYEAQLQSLAQAVSAFYAVNGCYPGDVGQGQMPPGLAPYVGGQWPSWADYSAFTQWTPPNGPASGFTSTSGATAYYVNISGYGPSVPGGSVPSVWIVYNSPVTIC